MDKKHKNRFSIVFNEFDDRQLFAIEKLNSLPPRKIAVYISEVIAKYEKRGKSDSTAITMEKRGRGRPKKVLNSEGVSGDKPLPPAETSSSHIQQPLKSSDVPSEQPQHGTNQDSEMKDNNLSVDDEMLDSMMAILGK